MPRFGLKRLFPQQPALPKQPAQHPSDDYCKLTSFTRMDNCKTAQHLDQPAQDVKNQHIAHALRNGPVASPPRLCIRFEGMVARWIGPCSWTHRSPRTARRLSVVVVHAGPFHVGVRRLADQSFGLATDFYFSVFCSHAGAWEQGDLGIATDFLFQFAFQSVDPLHLRRERFFSTRRFPLVIKLPMD
jgi:hypothetical protein